MGPVRVGAWGGVEAEDQAAGEAAGSGGGAWAENAVAVGVAAWGIRGTAVRRAAGRFKLPRQAVDG